MENKRFCWETRPLALKENQIKGANYRFTLLTEKLFRLEYCAEGVFEDRASQAVFYRDFPSVPHTVERSEGILTVKTKGLILKYIEDAPFSAQTLSIKLVDEPASTWYYGDDFEDLGGTARTLDVTDDGIPLGRGVCSLWGFSLLDDSQSLVLGDDGWIEPRAENSIDLYFFGYGYDYLAAVKDYLRLTGAPPLLPAYALGNWWSRYHRYTQEEYISLMERFKAQDIPFSVAVVDMDWHIVNIPEELKEEEELFKSGWTGYTWNEELFPDYKAFLKDLKGLNLHTALNLHPAQGVRRHEAMYEKAAIAAGIDPKSGKRVPLDVLSPTAMANYFDILHHPYEEEGVDFWWMDWQQGTDYWWIHSPNKDGVLQDPGEKLDPLWMLNHLHILDISRNGKRPMFFSRFAGAGSQRYPVGFSGDTRVTWDALKFQPYFTATASNIGYCWWSHDIGGHMHGYRDDNLAVRWVQLGVFSPINRLHSTSNRFQLKEAWEYGKEAEDAIGKWLRIRHGLFPYIYTMNYRCHTQLEPLVQPMYYSHPKCTAAYSVKGQFWFGSQLMVCPISEPDGLLDMQGRAEAWLPAGDWFDFETGLHYNSKKGRIMELFRATENYPVLAKSGAIVPMYAHTAHDNRLINRENMELVVFPAEDNEFTLYEDAGENHGYQRGEYVTTQIRLKWGKTALLTVFAAQGKLSLVPARRNWCIKLRGFNKDISLAATVGGVPCKVQTVYTAADNTHSIKLTADVRLPIQISITGDKLIHDNGDATERIFKLLAMSQISIAEKDRLYGIATDADLSLHDKIYRLGNTSPQQYHLVKAIKELLTLTEEEYE
ncbi:MAG: DUF5110 domain-containing protein [Clostridia bacterium]|nr:DUF5110 domain-containing protein [Clostridia bacterium]